eukprot:CAMPEP_0115502424 /NCGR_PEP_ID=MMETSP0271-20121206/68936_1 /TAXON_ID=71861 /ORGANISM="Scrippsiella trochoidea, Strain CCMP3099" /LENGTH=73 /DNA_ID=CAMNT_0002931449 /DNA_START=40 /DNA_END=258 /DNA_ORIENTATION=+
MPGCIIIPGPGGLCMGMPGRICICCICMGMPCMPCIGIPGLMTCCPCQFAAGPIIGICFPTMGARGPPICGLG